MKFKIVETGAVYNVEARKWKGNQYQPDCFQELEVNIVKDCLGYDEGSDALLIYDSDFQSLVDWWQEEFDCWEKGFSSEGNAEFEPIEMDLFIFREE